MRSLCILIAATVLLSASVVVSAAETTKEDCKSGCITRCPKCAGHCTISLSKDGDTRNTYGVECKPICIPRIVFPWQKRGCCGTKDCDCKSCADKDGKSDCSMVNNGARSRYIRVLKKYEYKCPACKYEWSSDKDRDGDKSAKPTAAPAAEEANIPEPPAVEARHLLRNPISEHSVSFER